MRGAFDTFLFADYSGAESVAAQKKAIALWRLDEGAAPRKIPGPFTRDALREAILESLVDATRRRQRVLFGIDHQWSWPRDLWQIAGLGGIPWRRAVARLVEGSRLRPPLAAPGVFPARFNAFARQDVFHCRVRRLALRYGVPTRSRWTGDSARLTERAMPGAKPATRLGGVGAVAGQTLHGLAQLHRLLAEAPGAGVRVLAWPFDALVDDGVSHVGAEIYPSFCRGRAEPKSDDADARACCVWAARSDLARALNLSDAPAAVRRAARIEGWILGALLPSP